jgi:hypothetical protein
MWKSKPAIYPDMNEIMPDGNSRLVQVLIPLMRNLTPNPFRRGKGNRSNFRSSSQMERGLVGP